DDGAGRGDGEPFALVPVLVVVELLAAGLGTRRVLLAARLGTRSGLLAASLGTGPRLLSARLGRAREAPVCSRTLARRSSATCTTRRSASTTSTSAPSSARTTALPLSARVVRDRAEEGEREPRGTNARPKSRLHGFAPFFGEALGDAAPY